MNHNEQDKPLFIPLNGEYFDAFEAGTKNTEFRPYGPKWNEEVCYQGRQVIISYGYGKQRRRTGTITRFYTSWEPTQGEDWKKLYADKHKGKPAACIQIQLWEEPAKISR
jgi:hypothetical protein